MNKGKNKGKIQKSRQNAEGREAGSFLGKAFDSYHKFLSNKVINFVINMILAIGTVLPFMMKMCNKVAFTYEVNDDAAIVQILDGSYTGTPDGHAIFIKYPLSWIIAKLYELNPKLPFTVPADNGTNWYVTAIVLLEVFALTVVLFRILNYFRCNRILICFFYTLAFVYALFLSSDIFYSCCISWMHESVIYWICKKRGTVETVEFTLSWYFRNIGILYEKTVLLYGHSIFAD